MTHTFPLSELTVTDPIPIEEKPGTMGMCDYCEDGPLPLHAAANQRVYCDFCMQRLLAHGIVTVVSSIAAHLDAILQTVEGSPLGSDIPLSDEVSEKPKFIVGPDGNPWRIADWITVHSLRCLHCEDANDKKGAAVLSPQVAAWAVVQCESCRQYLWLELTPSSTPTDDA